MGKYKKLTEEEIMNGNFGFGGDDLKFADMADDARAKAIAWINTYMWPAKKENGYHTSYGLKHYLQDDTGIYMSNNQFKQAMAFCGFLPVDSTELNWTYRISEKALNARWQ